MRKSVYLLALFVLLAALVACGQGEQPPPASDEQKVESAVEVPQPPPEPPQEEPVVELLPGELPARLQYIVDAGEFSGEFGYYGRYITYTNTALGIAYNYENDLEFSLFFGVGTEETPGVLMTAHGANKAFRLIVIAGSGEEWVRQQADDFVELYTEDWLERYEAARRYHGDISEEGIARSIERRDERLQQRAEASPDIPLELRIRFNPVIPDELDMVSFWPVEYEIAGRPFSGLQINVDYMGHPIGYTYLFYQLDDDTALVIFVFCKSWADRAARRHIARFSALP